MWVPRQPKVPRPKRTIPLYYEEYSYAVWVAASCVCVSRSAFLVLRLIDSRIL